jgi:polyribonucleotide nucleotidyltransferase
MNKKIVRKEIIFAGKKLVLETGELAFMATNAVKATYGDTVVLATVVAGEARPDIDFFPLTVNYEERLYAGGLIKSSRFVKRDGRPTDEATMAKRLIDHAIRPLFPKDYMDSVQVIVTVLSLDETSDPEFLAMTAASAVLHSSTIPWAGPMVSAKVGYINGELVINPAKGQEDVKNDLDMMVSFAGADKRFLAVEAKANILPEAKILAAMDFARDSLDPVLNLINEFAAEVNPEAKKYTYVSKALSTELMAEVSAIAKDKIYDIMKMELDKTEMTLRQEQITAEVLAALETKYDKASLLRALQELEKHSIQHLILDEGKRPDGRGITDIRPISASVGVLPRTHGSALFTRGVTQVLTVATLGSPSLELIVQNMYGEDTKRFLHYYNFPPYASGETGNIGSPKSREIGHGMLAEKGVTAVVPSQKEFPYMILLVSETLSSSGSSSMAATCASSLALMDAGVPIKDIVAGIGVGIIVNDDFSKYKIMTDLAYMEDAFGFLDFKMTGTKTGVTGMQADMKAQGIPMELLPKIIEQSREGRLHVLVEMEKVISKPRDAVSTYAPKMVTLQINPDKIGMVIGSGGKTIKELQEKTQTEIFIDQDGSVVVSSENVDNAKKAAEIINGMTYEIKEGEIYDGKVVELLDFGALMEILPGRIGLMHVSEIANQYVEKVEDWVHVGDTIKVKVINTSEDGKIGLSKKALEPGYDPASSVRPDRSDRGGRGGGRRSFDRGPRRGRN